MTTEENVSHILGGEESIQWKIEGIIYSNSNEVFEKKANGLKINKTVSQITELFNSQPPNLDLRYDESLNVVEKPDENDEKWIITAYRDGTFDDPFKDAYEAYQNAKTLPEWAEKIEQLTKECDELKIKVVSKGNSLIIEQEKLQAEKERCQDRLGLFKSRTKKLQSVTKERDELLKALLVCKRDLDRSVSHGNILGIINSEWDMIEGVIEKYKNEN